MPTVFLLWRIKIYPYLGTWKSTFEDSGCIASKMNIALSLPSGWRKCARLEDQTTKQACLTIPSPSCGTIIILPPLFSFLICDGQFFLKAKGVLLLVTLYLWTNLWMQKIYRSPGHPVWISNPYVFAYMDSMEMLTRVYSFDFWQAVQAVSVFFFLCFCFSFSITRSPVLVKGTQEALGAK